MKGDFRGPKKKAGHPTRLGQAVTDQAEEFLKAVRSCPGSFGKRLFNPIGIVFDQEVRWIVNPRIAHKACQYPVDSRGELGGNS